MICILFRGEFREAFRSWLQGKGTKAKTNKWNYIEASSFCTEKEITIKVKTNWLKKIMLHTMHLTEDYSPRYISKSQNLPRIKTLFRTNRETSWRDTTPNTYRCPLNTWIMFITTKMWQNDIKILPHTCENVYINNTR